ncbi:MAG TPA: hypothetical protein VK052_14195 [Zeimonas sp.]|nr:hypothetical protein [Zeimonas sp.]
MRSASLKEKDMDFRIERHGEELRVRIESATRSEQEVFDRVCACRGQSWWSCPSGECAKIGACDTRRDGETTVLALTPRPGEALSVAGVEECLRYVLADSIGAPAGGAPLSR